MTERGIQNLTAEHRAALAAALAAAWQKLEATFGLDCGIVLLAKPLHSEVVGATANIPPDEASALMLYALYGAHNVREHQMRGSRIVDEAPMDDHERYKRDAAATLAAVRVWQHNNPEAQPKLPPPDGVAVLSSLCRAIEQQELTDSGLALARYVADKVEGATWLMFYFAWKVYYEDAERN